MKSQWIRQLLVDSIVKLPLQKVKVLFSFCEYTGPSAASFPGLVFEAIAILYMSGAAPDTDEVFRGFAPMTPVASGKHPRTFSYRPEKATTTLTVNDRASTLSLGLLMNTQTRSTPLPPSPLGISRYGKVADIPTVMEGMGGVQQCLIRRVLCGRAGRVHHLHLPDNRQSGLR